MDDNIDLEPSDPYISKEHDQSDLLKYQMANPNQLVPGYQDESEEDDLDDGLAQNQSSFIPSHMGKEYLDSSLSDSNVGFEQEEDMLLDPSRGQGDDLVIQGQTNPFQPDLPKMNPLSLESKSGHADNIFAPNDLSKMPSAQLGFEEYTPSSQTPDLLMMDSSSPVHSGKSDVLEETVKQSCDTEFKSAEESNLQIQNVLHGKQEAIENDFYNADEKMDNYDDEYVDSEESDYSDYSDEKDENETGLEQIVPELKEKQHSELKTENENIFNNDIDPNVAASGLSMKEGDFSKNVQFDENIVHSQFSDEENGNIAGKTSQQNFVDAESVDYLKQEAPGSVTGGNENVPVIESSSTIAREENVESVETRMDDTEMKPAETEGIPKSSTFTIESDNSDFEDPVHNPLENMQGGPMFQDFAVGHSEGQGQIKDLMGGTLMDESEDSDDLDDEEIEDIDTRHMEQQTDNTNPFEMGSYSTNTGEQSMLNPETVQNNQTDLQQSQSFGDQLSDNVDTFSNKDQNPSYVESVDNAEVPFQQYQTLGEKSSEDMNYPYDASFIQQQSQFSDEQQLLDNTKKSSDYIDMDNEIVEDKCDDFAEISKLEQQPLQSQDQESLIIDTSKEMIKDSESEEMNIEKSFQQTTELETSSDAQTGAMMNLYDIQNQILEHNMEDFSKTELDTEKTEQFMPETKQSDLDMLGQGQVDSSESEDETYGEKIQSQSKESGMAGSIVLDEGESFNDEKNEQEMDESISSEEEVDSPNKDPISSQLKQSLTEEMNQEREITDKAQVSEVSPDNLETLSQARVSENENEDSIAIDEGVTFEGQASESNKLEIEQLSSAEASTANQMKETGIEGSQVLDDRETIVDKSNEPEFEPLSPGVSPVDEILTNQMRESGMEGSFVLDEGQTFEDKHFENEEEEFVQSNPDSPDDEIPANQMRESGMEGSFVLDEGETFEDKKFENDEKEFVQSTPEVSPEDEIPTNQMRESGMEGSFVLDDGQTFDDKQFANNEGEFVQSTPEVSPEDEIPTNQMRESGMEGSFVLDEGETFDDKQFANNEEEFVQSTPEVSPEDEIPANQMRESGMEGSFVFDEGETFDDKQFTNNEEEFVQSTPEVSPEDEIPANQMRESGMEGSFVLDEGETFEDKKFEDDEKEFVQSTPEVSPEDEIPANQMRESGMEGSFVFDEGETFDDKQFANNEEEFVQSTPEISPEDEIPANQMRESGMKGSIVLDEGETFDTKTDNLNKNRVMEATPYDNELPCEQGLPGVPGVDESNVIGDDDKEYEYHEKKDSFSSEEESTQKDLEPTNDMKESGMGGSIVLDDGQTFDEGIETNETSNEKEHAYSIPSDEFAIEPEIEGTSGLAEKEVTENKLEESVDTGTLDTPVDSYAEEGDVDSAIQSPFSQDGMIQSPSSDVNAAIYVEHENEKNLMSSSLIEESFGLNQGETNETYQSCLQNGISHSTSEEVTPEKEEAKPVCYQNGISQSASEEFTPEKEAKLTDFDTIKNDEQKVPDGKLEEKDFVSNTEVKKELESKKISFDVKKVEKESSKKTTKLSKPEIKKKDITKETRKIPKDITMKKDTLSKLPSPTKLTTEKRSVSASGVTTVPPTRTTKPTTRMPRDTTRKPRPTTTNEPTKPTQIKQRPKSIDISRTSSLTRPTASSLSKSRTFEKSAMEGASSPTKPMRSLPKTAPSRYRITKSKKGLFSQLFSLHFHTVRQA